MTNVAALAVFLLGSVSPQQVTIQQLNSSPEKFDGLRVTVSGWIVIDDEKRYIVAQPRDYTMWRKGATCLSVINGEALDEREKDYNGKHVHLQGVFRADVRSGDSIRLGLCSATGLDLENAPVDGKVALIPR